MCRFLLLDIQCCGIMHRGTAIAAKISHVCLLHAEREKQSVAIFFPEDVDAFYLVLRQLLVRMVRV